MVSWGGVLYDAYLRLPVTNDSLDLFWKLHHFPLHYHGHVHHNANILYFPTKCWLEQGDQQTSFQKIYSVQCKSSQTLWMLSPIPIHFKFIIFCHWRKISNESTKGIVTNTQLLKVIKGFKYESNHSSQSNLRVWSPPWRWQCLICASTAGTGSEKIWMVDIRKQEKLEN